MCGYFWDFNKNNWNKKSFSQNKTWLSCCSVMWVSVLYLHSFAKQFSLWYSEICCVLVGRHVLEMKRVKSDQKLILVLKKFINDPKLVFITKNGSFSIQTLSFVLKLFINDPKLIFCTKKGSFVTKSSSFVLKKVHLVIKISSFVLKKVH